MKRLWMACGALCVAAATATAQVASSSSFTLDGFGLSGAADGTASDGTAALVANDPAAADGELVSSGFRAQVGFLNVHDPLDADAPTILAVSPEHGTIDGGTPVVIRGLHFERNGLAGVVNATIGGAPLSNLSVVSDTTITGEAPVGTFGPKDVEVATALGATGLGESFLHSPGIRISPQAYQAGALLMRNAGPVGATFQTYFSTFQTSIPLPPYGTLLIGPTQLVPAIENGIYPGPDGIDDLVVPVPSNPAFAGITLYLQSVAVLSFAPLDIRFVNADSVLLF